MGAIRDLAERLWNGETSAREFNPWVVVGETEEIAEGTLHYRSFANVTAFQAGEELVLIDTGAFFDQPRTHDAIREWSPSRLDTAVYTHGHTDHVFGVPPFAEEARQRGWQAPRVIGHKAVAERFDRYVYTNGYNAFINIRQFGGTIEETVFKPRGLESPWAPSFPSSYTYPDTYYDDAMTISLGDTTFELHHARGETDDHTWVWVPERKVLCPGDLIIWAVPNAGNPQKVQRYCAEWAQALRTMASLGAEVLSPGHGVPVIGKDRVKRILVDTAEYLQSLHDQTIQMMNEGESLDTIVRTVKPPAHLEGLPYLQATYDEPEFIVRNVWRLYGGWYDGNPAHLKPAPEGKQAAEVARLAGGVPALLKRARELLNEGDLQLACHVIEWASVAAPEDREAHDLRREIYGQRSRQELGLMARNVFRYTERESEMKSK
jgi:alkyl sulfatase BDS1-like metallo-beta-lactamase superfamily hydrolase